MQNNVTDYDNADIFVAITRPDGKILKNEDVTERLTHFLNIKSIFENIDSEVKLFKTKIKEKTFWQRLFEWEL